MASAVLKAAKAPHVSNVPRELASRSTQPKPAGSISAWLRERSSSNCMWDRGSRPMRIASPVSGSSRPLIVSRDRTGWSSTPLDLLEIGAS